MANNSIPMMPYGLQKAPTKTTKSTALLDVLYSMGVPTFSRDSGMDGYFTIDQYMNRNKPAAAAPQAPAATPDPLADMPEWYRKWYEAQGRYGRVTPVRGLL